ncbi:MAG: ABC transporter substrate-binding protein [Solirubrobacteraceae bacterium]
MGDISNKRLRQHDGGGASADPLTRRDLIRGGTALTATLGLGGLLAACGSSNSGGATSTAASSTISASSDLFPDLSGQTITMVTYGGESGKGLAAAYADPFAEKTGLKILQDAPVDLAKIKAQVDAGHVTWDVFDGDPLTAVGLCREGIIEPLNPIVMKGIAPKYASGKCAVPINVYAAVLAYDTKKFGNAPPTSWADFFDTKKYPGKRGLWTALFLNQFEVALLGDGVPPDQLYPLDLDRAIAKLDSIKDDILFFDSLGQGGEQMVTQSVVMTCQTNSRGLPAVEAGAPFAPVWNQAVLAWECWSIPKGSPNKAPAEAFLRYMGTAEAQARVAETLSFGSTAENPIVPKNLSQTVLDWLPTTPENSAKAVPLDPKWWSNHYEEAIERYTEWVSS